MQDPIIMEIREVNGQARPVVTDGWFTDYPVFHEHDGSVSYDFPERIPDDVKNEVTLWFMANGQPAPADPPRVSCKNGLIGPGSCVQFSAAFLRSTGQYTGGVPFKVGTVRHVETAGSLSLVRVNWNDGTETSVVPKHLVVKGVPEPA